MDPITQERILTLESSFAGVITQLVGRAAAAGIDLRVTQARRSWALQKAYWLQGRASLEAVNAARLAVGLAAILLPSGNYKVTNAPPGWGWHEYGLAADVCPFDLTGHPDWNESHPVWGQLISMGEAIGLKSGSTFRSIHDDPHFQPLAIPESPTDAVRQAYQAGGISAVYNLLELAA